jgi:HK97 family phage prohead protease
MPIYYCESNGKYRIGSGECVFSSRENAVRAYQAYLAQHPEAANESKAADMNKVSFDFDGTISKEQWQQKAMQFKDQGKTLYIVTRRQESDSEPVYAVADKIGIPHSRVYFTNGKLKWETIKKLGIGTHYDNNPDEIKAINENTDANGKLVGSKNNSMIYNYKSLSLEVKDVDTKAGEVVGYFSAFGNVDSDGDIMMPGAFKRSIQDWGPEGKGRIKHLLNHDPSKPLGKIMDLKEDEYGLYYRSKIGTHQLGRDFVKMVESGLIAEHSIGFKTLREQKSGDANQIHEVMLFEGSSLTAWGANEATPLLGMKNMNNIEQIQDQIKSFEKFIRNSDVTDETIDLCILKVKQLAELVERMSSTKAVDETPAQQKEEEVPVESFINIINKF